jgi:hypothetical protein
MRTIQFYSDRFPSVSAQLEAIQLWRPRYEGLIVKLGTLGTEVSVARTIESDAGVRPHTFFRRAFHDFIFPAQEIGVEVDNSRPVSSASGFEVRYEYAQRSYDLDRVTGRLSLSYDDANNRIELMVCDAIEGGESVLDEAVLTELRALEAAGALAV